MSTRRIAVVAAGILAAVSVLSTAGPAQAADPFAISCTKYGSTLVLAPGARVGWGLRIQCTTTDGSLASWSGDKFTLLSSNPTATAVFRATDLGDGSVTATPSDDRDSAELSLTVVRSTLGPR